MSFSRIRIMIFHDQKSNYASMMPQNNVRILSQYIPIFLSNDPGYITHRLIDPIICTAIFIVWVGTEKSTMTIKLKPCQMLSSMTKNDYGCMEFTQSIQITQEY